MSDTRRFKYYGGGTEEALQGRDGELVEVLGPVDEKEHDRADVGDMFEIRFEDGYETVVFDDELDMVSND